MNRAKNLTQFLFVVFGMSAQAGDEPIKDLFFPCGRASSLPS